MKIPDSPLHPRANEEINELPEGQLPDIDLNPDLESEDDNQEENQQVNGNTQEEGGFIPAMAQVVPEPFNEGLPPDHTNGHMTEKPSVAEDLEEEMNFPSITPTLEQAYEDAQQEFQTHQVINGTQQSRLINYLDEELLKIQRKFVKTQSGQVRVTINDILLDLMPLLKLIWMSITANSNNTIEYFLKILTDLEDYLMHFPVPNPTNIMFETLQYIDVRISYLYDQKLYNSTQFVRTLSIVSRLRMELITKLSNSSSTVIELESSKLFEGILERS